MDHIYYFNVVRLIDKVLPNDISRHILDFLYTKCDRCNETYYMDRLIKGKCFCYYNTIFDDDFPFTRVYNNYKYICNDCILQLKDRDIIVMPDNN